MDRIILTGKCLLCKVLGMHDGESWRARGPEMSFAGFAKSDRTLFCSHRLAVTGRSPHARKRQLPVPRAVIGSGRAEPFQGGCQVHECWWLNPVHEPSHSSSTKTNIRPFEVCQERIVRRDRGRFDTL